MAPTPEEVADGHAFYTIRSLAVYDLAILGWFSRWPADARIEDPPARRPPRVSRLRACGVGRRRQLPRTSV